MSHEGRRCAVSCLCFLLSYRVVPVVLVGLFLLFFHCDTTGFGADVNLGMYLSKWEYHGTGYVSTITAVVVHTIGSSWNLPGDLLYLTC